jgi:hypothetical protein
MDSPPARGRTGGLTWRQCEWLRLERENVSAGHARTLTAIGPDRHTGAP